MNRSPHRRPFAGAAVVAVAGAMALQAAAGATPLDAPGHRHRHATPDQQAALSAGLQVAPKGSVKGKAAQPDPYLANVLDATKVDYATWQKRLARKAVARTKTAAYRHAR